MKNILILILGFLIASPKIIAQTEMKFGLKAGVNLANIGGDFSDNTRGIFGFNIGGLAEVPIIKNLSLQPEILFSSQGSKRDDRAGDGPLVVTKLNYINAPIMAKYYFTDGFSIMGGPQIGLLVAAKSELTPSGFGGGEYSEENIKDDMNALDIGLGIGAEYRLPFGAFAQFRYVFGLSNVNDNSEDRVLGYYYFPDVKSRNNVLQVSLGYSF
jgi:hypothetical protein